MYIWLNIEKIISLYLNVVFYSIFRLSTNLNDLDRADIYLMAKVGMTTCVIYIVFAKAIISALVMRAAPIALLVP